MNENHIPSDEFNNISLLYDNNCLHQNEKMIKKTEVGKHPAVINWQRCKHTCAENDGACLRGERMFNVKSADIYLNESYVNYNVDDVLESKSIA